MQAMTNQGNFDEILPADLTILANTQITNSPLSWDPCLDSPHFGIWRNIVIFAIFVTFAEFVELAAFLGPLSRAHSPQFWDLAKYRQIRHFRHCLHFWTYLDFAMHKMWFPRMILQPKNPCLIGGGSCNFLA